MTATKDKPLEGDYPEDYAHENGNYWHDCPTCMNSFMGHKRRIHCKVCAGKIEAPKPLEGDLDKAIDYLDVYCGPDTVNAGRHWQVAKSHIIRAAEENAALREMVRELEDGISQKDFEIMFKKDGMQRRNEIREYMQKHSLKIVAIKSGGGE